MTKEKLTKEEKIEKGVEFIENGLYNLDNVQKVGLGVLSLAKDQIKNGLKLIKDEEVEDGVFGL